MNMRNKFQNRKCDISSNIIYGELVSTLYDFGLN